MYRLLCADDESLIREALTLFVERLGLAIECVPDGATCVEAFRSSPGDYDLVIVDYDMPGMDGIEVFLELRRIDPGQRLAISTAYPERDVLDRLPPGEVVAFLRKPYTVADLRRFLRRGLPGVEPRLLVLGTSAELADLLTALGGDRYRVEVCDDPARLLRTARGGFADVVCLDEADLDLEQLKRLEAELIPVLIFGQAAAESDVLGTVLPHTLTSAQLVERVESLLR